MEGIDDFMDDIEVIIVRIEGVFGSYVKDLFIIIFSMLFVVYVLIVRV